MNTWQIKYTSQIMLEPLPALTSLMAVLCYIRLERGRRGWILASGLMLGITAASKYTYCIAGLAVAADWLAHLWADREDHQPVPAVRRLLPLAGWGLLALLVFFAADPRLWADPFSRLAESLRYHADYAASSYVADAGYPPWQPLIWLFSSVPWHPGVFWVSLEFLYVVLAVFGFNTLWKKQRVMAIWLALALVFLLVWTTKWPQYILILTAPFSLAAAQGFRKLVAHPFASWWRERRRGG